MTTKTFDFRALVNGLEVRHPVRSVLRDGAVWFVAADVCRVLALAPNKGSFASHLRKLAADEITLCSRQG